MSTILELETFRLIDELKHVLEMPEDYRWSYPTAKQLLQKILEGLPRDMRLAQRVLEEPKRILEEAKLEAANIISLAVSKEAVVAEARREAERIITRAKSDAETEAQKIRSQIVEDVEDAEVIRRDAETERQKAHALWKTFQRRVTAFAHTINRMEAEINMHLGDI